MPSYALVIAGPNGSGKSTLVHDVLEMTKKFMQVRDMHAGHASVPCAACVCVACVVRAVWCLPCSGMPKWQPLCARVVA